MENSTPPTWIQWISREANKLCNELTLVIDQGMNETLLEFRLIPKDVEPEGEQQQDLMGFETLRPDNAIENRGGRGQQPSKGIAATTSPTTVGKRKHHPSKCSPSNRNGGQWSDRNRGRYPTSQIKISRSNA